MRTFVLTRIEDFSGVSGIGNVAEGVEFSDGTCVMKWKGELSSMAIYPSAQTLIDIHGHQGRTVVVFDDGELVTDNG